MRQQQEQRMKNRFVWASALALAVAMSSQTSISGATHGVIFISTRAPQDTAFGSEYVSDEKGPGMATPGDVAMASLLHDNGYTCRLILDRLVLVPRRLARIRQIF
jgi:hypothetical protein